MGGCCRPAELSVLVPIGADVPGGGSQQTLFLDPVKVSVVETLLFGGTASVTVCFHSSHADPSVRLEQDVRSFSLDCYFSSQKSTERRNQ